MIPGKQGFLDLPVLNQRYGESAVVIIPAPYDGTSTWIKGSDKGPAALLEASLTLELLDIETGSEAYKAGIFVVEEPMLPEDAEAMTHEVQGLVSRALRDGKTVATLGGEHSVTIGALRAHKERFPGLSVLQLDAHADLREEYLGSPYNHACVMARAREICPVVQVGIRSMAPEEKPEKGRIFYAHSIHDHDSWMEEAIEKLTADVYITIDLDVFDPSIMPSTGTPEPGGLGWYQTLRFLRKVAAERNVVGFDIVELCPNDNKAPDYLAAKLLYKMITYLYEKGSLKDAEKMKGGN